MISTQLSMLSTIERFEGPNKTLLLGPHREPLDHVRGVPLHRHCEDHRVPIALTQSLELKLPAKSSIHSLHIGHAEQVGSDLVEVIDEENRKPPELRQKSEDERRQGVWLKRAYHSIESDSSLNDPNGSHGQHLPIPSTEDQIRSYQRRRIGVEVELSPEAVVTEARQHQREPSYAQLDVIGRSILDLRADRQMSSKLSSFSITIRVTDEINRGEFVGDAAEDLRS
jgi:hypothetical protein